MPSRAQSLFRHEPAEEGLATLPPTWQSRLETELLGAVQQLPEPGGEQCRRIIAAGGKRLRPDLLVRSAYAVGGAFSDRAVDQLVVAAGAVELLHTATLLHDDLLDDSATRRGVRAVHRVHGRSAAVIVGDALIGHSWRLIAPSGPGAVVDLAVALQDMCAGEAGEDMLRYDATAGALAALRVSRLKTGALLGACCRVGARLGGAAERDVDAFGRFGTDFGLALQLVDDVLDVISDESMLGKPCAADFAAGTLTMPAVFALGSDQRVGAGGLSPAERRELRGLLRPGLSDVERERSRQLLVRSGGPARTIGLARAFAGRAAASLPVASPGGAALRRMPGRFVEKQLASKVAPRDQWVLTDGGPDVVASPDSLQLLQDVG